MMRMVPPAGCPISIAQLTRATSLRLRSDDLKQAVSDRVRAISGAKHHFYFGSGRSCLTLALKALHSLQTEKRNEVIIPAYTCYSVAAAIVRAGLKIKLVDIKPETLDYDYQQLEASVNDNTLALVSCNLFGILSDLNHLRQIASSHNSFLIDDAAQAMGSRPPSDTRPDIGFYSLDRGKNITAGSGGVLFTDQDRFAETISELMGTISPPGIGTELKCMISLGLYGRLLHPGLFWIPAGLPFLKLGETIFEPEFEINQLSRFQMSMTLVKLDDLENYNDRRKRTAQQIINGISNDNRYLVPGLTASNPLPYLRLPVLCRDRATRDRLIDRLRKAGISSSAMYPDTIDNIPGIRPNLVQPDRMFSGGEKVVERLITLPTHPLVNTSDIEKILTEMTDLTN